MTWAWVLLLMSTACVAPSTPAKPAESVPRQSGDERVQQELETCRQQARADGIFVYSPVEVVGELTSLGAIRHAELLDCRARVAYRRADQETARLAEANVKAWEGLPGQTSRLASALTFYGKVLALVEVDMAAAEPQYRRALALANSAPVEPSEVDEALFAQAAH